MKLSFDSSLCTGCKNCELVCSAYHSGEFHPGRTRIRVKNEPFYGQSSISACRVCEEQACVNACAVGACTLDVSTRLIHIDEEQCTQCYACVEACPDQAMFIDEVSQFPIVCDGCEGKFLCVELCYKKALDKE